MRRIVPPGAYHAITGSPDNPQVTGSCHDPGMDELRLGRLLRTVRQHRNLRQVDLARAAGLSQGTVSSLERGRIASASRRDALREDCVHQRPR
jgi:Helix-turn-helix domain